MTTDIEWQHTAVKLANTGAISWRQIAALVDVPKSTVSDFLRDYMSMKQEAINDTYVEGRTHIFIPDSQVRKDISVDFLRWIGEYIVRKQPDVIVHGGDFADFESLSSYDRGKRSAENKRVKADIDAAILGMETLLAPLRRLQAQQLAEGIPVYRPRQVLTLGNHEDRLDRYVNDNPELHEFLDMSALKYEEFGWEVIPFLTPINIDGVNYCHYFPNVMTGKALTGTSANMLKTIGESFTMGHRQTLDVTTRFLPSSGVQQWGLIAGAGYPHDEHYKGVQGNKHWRGIVVKHNVRNGSYDPLFVSLNWLEKRYGKVQGS